MAPLTWKSLVAGGMTKKNAAPGMTPPCERLLHAGFFAKYRPICVRSFSTPAVAVVVHLQTTSAPLGSR